MNTTLWFPVTVLTTNNYIVTTNCSKGVVYAFHLKSTTNNDKGTIFSRHEARVHDMAHLFGDVVVSVDKSGMAHVWDAETAQVLDSFQAPDYRRLLYVQKLDARQFAVAATSIRTGNVAHMLYVFTHNRGIILKNETETKKLSPGGVLFGTHDRNVYVKTTVKAFKVNIDTLKKLSFSNPPIASCYNFEFFAAVNHQYIILSYWNQSMLIYSNDRRNCAHIRTVDISAFSDAHEEKEEEYLRAITIIDEDLLMITTQKYGVYFTTLKGKAVAKIAVTKSDDLRNACVTADGRICVVGADAYCGIWNSPPEVKLPVLKYAQSRKVIGVDAHSNGDANGYANGTAVPELKKSSPRIEAGKTSDDNDNDNINGNGELTRTYSRGEERRQPKLLEMKARHSMELGRQEKRLAAQHTTELEKRLAAQKKAHEAEITSMQNEIAELRTIRGDETANAVLRNKLAVCEVKLAACDSERDKLLKQLEAARIEKKELEEAREKNRQYRKSQTRMDIEAVKIKAQLEVQNIELKSLRDQLQWQVKKTEKAVAEANRISGLAYPPPKKRRINSHNI